MAPPAANSPAEPRPQQAVAAPATVLELLHLLLCHGHPEGGGEGGGSEGDGDRATAKKMSGVPTRAEASAKLPHNVTFEGLTRILRDHGEGVHLDRLGVPFEKESDQATRAACESRHEETEFDRVVAARAERSKAALMTKLSIGVSELHVPEEVGNLDELLINKLLKPRVAARASCDNYDSIQDNTKGQHIKTVLKEILTNTELISLTSLTTKIITIVKAQKSNSSLMWTLEWCLQRIIKQRAASQAQEAWKELVANKSQQLLILGKALLRDQHTLTEEILEELQKLISAVEAIPADRD